MQETSKTPPKAVAGEAVSVAVVVPTLGRNDSILRLLASIEEQTVKPVELVIVDQNPEPALERILGSRSGIPRTILRLREPNASAARNRGFEQTSASHVLFLDDDERLPSTFIARVIEVMSRHPGIGCLWPIVDEGDRKAATRAVRRTATGKTIPGSTLFEVRLAGSGGVTFDRRIFRQAGGYDEVLFRYAGMFEDGNLSWRMQRAGLEIWADSSLVVLHDRAARGGCAIRSDPYREVRARAVRATTLQWQLSHATAEGARFADLTRVLRAAFLSRFRRDDSMRELVRSPLWHAALLIATIRESRETVLQCRTNYLLDDFAAPRPADGA